MKVIEITPEQRRAIEEVILKVASRDDFLNSDMINIEVMPENSIIKFSAQGSKGIGLGTGLALTGLALATPLLKMPFKGLSFIAKGLWNSVKDPEIDKVIDELVQSQIQEPGSQLIPDQKETYKQMIKSILEKGIQEVRAKAEAAHSQGQKTSSVISNIFDEEIELLFKLATLEAKTPGGLQKGMQALKGIGKNILTGITNFFTGTAAKDLVNRIVDLTITKGQIPKEYKSTLLDYMNNAIQSGFHDLSAKLEQSEKSVEQQTQQPAGEQQTTSTATPSTSPAPAPDQAQTETKTVPASQALQQLTQKYKSMGYDVNDPQVQSEIRSHLSETFASLGDDISWDKIANVISDVVASFDAHEPEVISALLNETLEIAEGLLSNFYVRFSKDKEAFVNNDKSWNKMYHQLKLRIKKDSDNFPTEDEMQKFIKWTDRVYGNNPVEVTPRMRMIFDLKAVWNYIDNIKKLNEQKTLTESAESVASSTMEGEL
jgi:hypothetical protein